MSFVLDASMTMAWHFEDETSGRADKVRMMIPNSAIFVPDFWAVEVANILVVGERRGRSTPEQSARFAQQLKVMDLRVDSEGSSEALSRVLPLARAHRLTAYDALYLELAERLGLPLATLDRQLGEAAATLGLTVL